jgi:hypothetical protein
MIKIEIRKKENIEEQKVTERKKKVKEGGTESGVVGPEKDKSPVPNEGLPVIVQGLNEWLPRPAQRNLPPCTSQSLSNFKLITFFHASMLLCCT